MTTKKSAPAARTGEGAEELETIHDKSSAPSSEGSTSSDDGLSHVLPATRTFLGASDSLSEIESEIVQEHCAQDDVTWDDHRAKDVRFRASAVRSAWRRLNGAKQASLYERLPARLVAEMILALREVRVIEWSGTSRRADDDSGFLAVYDEETGIYESLSGNDSLTRLVHYLEPTVDSRGVVEVRNRLRTGAEWVTECAEEHLMPFENGVLDWRTKELLPHSPDRPFVRRFPVRWVPGAPLPKITMSDGEVWDPESWMRSLTVDGDKELVEMLWEVVGGLFRPSVLGGRIVAPYGKGRNGKGTLSRLLSNLCGGPAYAPNLSISDFEKEYHTSQMIGAVAVLGDENEVGAYYKDLSVLKSVATGDTFPINAKFKDPITYLFRGLVFEPLNELPRFKDGTYSMFRRWLFVPMLCNFTEGERPEIKKDYLGRQEVLEYVVHRVLTMNYERVREPQAVLDLKAEVMVENDPALAFWEEFGDVFVWDLLPVAFLYDLFAAWWKKTNPSGSALSKTAFLKKLSDVMATNDDWEFAKAVRPSGRMDRSETLIANYDLKDWFNPAYDGPDSFRKSMPALASTYRGYVRTAASPAPGATATATPYPPHLIHPALAAIDKEEEQAS
ncbi:DNA primase family protein [Brevibacterium aurantiacum]|uniref:DNA primase family protein n=1 Tax=Brevibacterium aurantiacum TaxID=273384 RepID=UPI001866BDC5|nr:phage/plasmid primase, P4 family [Brevibacterium aurantiacum]